MIQHGSLKEPLCGVKLVMQGRCQHHRCSSMICSFLHPSSPKFQAKTQIFRRAELRVMLCETSGWDAVREKRHRTGEYLLDEKTSRPQVARDRVNLCEKQFQNNPKHWLTNARGPMPSLTVSWCSFLCRTSSKALMGGCQAQRLSILVLTCHVKMIYLRA